MIVDLWADGSGTTAGNPGGWAWLLRTEPEGKPVVEREGAGYTDDATSQRMELTAVIEGLNELTRPCQVRVFSDSEYLVKGFTERRVEKWKRNGWKTSNKEPVKNRDLWDELAAAVDRHEVEWNHVAGHAGIEFNERVDVLAGQARQVALGKLSPLELLGAAA